MASFVLKTGASTSEVLSVRLVEDGEQSLSVEDPTTAVPLPPPPPPPDPDPNPGPGPTPPPPPPVPSGTLRTLYGACPVQGINAAAVNQVSTKYGGKVFTRLFTDSWSNPTVTANGLGAHVSYKPGVNKVISGAHDAAIASLALNTPATHVIEIWHEPDHKVTKGVIDPDGTKLTYNLLVAAKNRFYNVAKAANPGVLIANTLTGGSLSEYGGTSEDEWGAVSADILGCDCDGVHDKTAPLDIPYEDEIASSLAFIKKYASQGYRYWSVPEFGTSRPAYDTSGSLRAAWFDKYAKQFRDAGALYVCWYDVESTPGNTLTTGSPELAVAQKWVATNPASLTRLPATTA